ncbi:hypothetical protein P1X14_10345 [Sphingomonas sp. AOB5]|uniref:hypothetical protein n=1 Tax=Sphingomonas sp. AOB5 TaxID=3034017 RepID=UPI0023F8AAD7|nr:hypothetical protein [Sphingomonas sp. AOB5]MDF7775647.1 hypothetical protein [Sphingomonas sp. AOB5]
MRRLMLAIAAAAVLPLTPALADWPPSKWGMTPEQVQAAVPGAKIVPFDSSFNLRGLNLLAEAPVSDAGLQLKARYYFAPGTRQLGMIDFLPNNPDDCAAYRNALIARYGKGESEESVMGEGDQAFDVLAIEWPNAGTDRMNYAEAKRGDMIGMCKLIIQKR